MEDNTEAGTFPALAATTPAAEEVEDQDLLVRSLKPTPSEITLDRPVNLDRPQWTSRTEFVLSCIGASVGLGNVWRFPYLAYDNGGGAFIIPYIIFSFGIGKPLYFMEVAAGQYSGRNSCRIWAMSPACVGYAMIVMNIFVASYYSVLLAYSLHYFFSSFQEKLPWSWCDPEWCNNKLNQSNKSIAELYWQNRVLHFYDVKHGLGPIQWELALTLMLCWLVAFICLVRGVQSIGKVAYVTSIFPYIVMISLLVMGLLQDGAIDGLKYFFEMDTSKILNGQTWRLAAEQVFFSLGISWGGLIAYGSYNKFSSPVHKDVLIASSADCFTSILAGSVIFCVLGSMAKDRNVDIGKVAAQGRGLAFIAYPEGIAKTSLPQLWSTLFFLMLFMMGLSSEFTLLGNMTAFAFDKFPHLSQHKILVTFGICFVLYCVGLPMVTKRGSLLLDAMDGYGGGLGILVIAAFETMGVMWVYGIQNFSDDLHFMLGFEPDPLLKTIWLISPVALFVVLLYSTANWEDPVQGEAFIVIGWIVFALIVIQVPAWFITKTVRAQLMHGNWKISLMPRPMWGPADKDTWDKRQDYQRAPNIRFANWFAKLNWKTKETGLHGV